MKKIIALLLALMVSTTVIANSFKANATALTASVLYYLIQCCADILVGSGTVTQQQFNEMNTSDILNTTKSAMPSIDFSSLPKDPVSNLNCFLAQELPKTYAPVYAVQDFLFKKFILGMQTNLDSVNPELKGYGAMAVVTIKSTSDMWSASNYICNVSFYYGTSGVIGKDKSGNPNLANIKGDNIIRQYTEYRYSDGETKPMVEYTYSGSISLGGAFLKDSTNYSETKFVGDWRYEDGTPATDMLTFVQEVPESIGTVDIDGTTYDVNGDGTVTIGDETIPINDDGSVTVDDKPYYPVYDLSPYDDTAIKDLLTDILNKIDVVDDTPIDDADKVIDDAPIDAPAIANSELSSLLLPKTISTVFPFCIPRDFYIGIKMLSAEPEAPKFEVPFEIPEYGCFPGVKKMIVIDFSEYSSAFAVVRWVNYILFMFAICFITFKIVKGV